VVTFDNSASYLTQILGIAELCSLKFFFTMGYEFHYFKSNEITTSQAESYKVKKRRKKGPAHVA